MKPLLTILPCLLSFVSIAQSEEALSATFIGNQAFMITDGKTTLLTDFPYQSGYSGYMHYDKEDVNPVGKTLCLITHNHKDHFYAPEFTNDDWYLLAPSNIKTDDASRLTYEQPIVFEDIEITAIPSSHANIEHYSYLVNWKGKSLFFPGDTEDVEVLTKAENVDVLFITPWLISMVKRQNMKLSAKKIIVYHHTTDEEIDFDGCIIPKQGQVITL